MKLLTGTEIQGGETGNTKLQRQNSGGRVNAQRNPLMGFIFSTFIFNFYESYIC